jgi:tape measure domain-containing protein
MVTVASLRAVIGLDNSDFKRGANETKRDIKDLRSEMSTVAGFLQGFGASLTAAVSVPIGAVAVGSVQAATSLDSLKKGLGAVAGSSQETERQLRRLREVAKLPGLGFEEAVRGSINLQSAGISAELAERALRGFGNALATVGKGKNDLQGVIIALGQIQSKGKISAEEINQLNERVPQIRRIMQEAFGTADTELLQKLGVTSEEFITRVIGQFEKLPPVVGGAQNAFENFQDSMNTTLATLGEAILPVVVPALTGMADAGAYVTRIFAALPGPIKGTVLILAGLVAAVGPVILIVGTLAQAVLSTTAAWTAYTALRAGIVGTQVATTEATAVTTGAINLQTAALGRLAAAAGIALGAVTAFVGGWIIGEQINDKFIGSIERQAQATEDATAAMVKAKPFLEQAIEARRKLAQANDLIAKSGREDLKNSPRYQELLKQAGEIEKRYTAASEMMGKGFDRAAAEAAVSGKKIKEEFSKAVDDAQKKLQTLRAPTLEARLKIEFPGIDEAGIKRLAVVQKQIEAEEKLRDTRQKANEENARSIEQFRQKIEDARRDIAALQAPDNLSRVRATAPRGTPESLIRELAGLRDTEDALKKVQEKREDERRKVEDLDEKLRKLNGTLSSVSTSVGTFTGNLGPGTGGSARTGAWQDQIKALAREMGLVISSGLRPGAVARGTGNPSLHGTGTREHPGALDVSGTSRQMAAFFETVKREFSGSIREMFFSPSGQVTGRGFSPTVTNPKTRADHFDHVHVALYEKSVKSATAALAATVPVITTVNAAQDRLTASQRAAATLAAGIGADAAGRLIEGTIQLRTQLGVLTAATDRDRVAVELTGVAYSRLNQAQRSVVDQNLALRRSVQKVEDLKRLGDAWNDQRVTMLKVAATTDQEKLSLELLKRSFGSLTPLMQTRINQMVEWTRQSQEAARSQEAIRKQQEAISNALANARGSFLGASAATDTQRIALDILREHVKELPDTIKDANDALDYMWFVLGLDTDAAIKAAEAIARYNARTKELGREQSFKNAIGESRAKLLELFATTEEERIALGFFKDRMSEIPPSVRTAGEALDYLEKKLGANVGKAREAAAEIVANQKIVQNSPVKSLSSFTASIESMGKGLKSWAERLEAVRKRAEDFNREMSQRQDIGLMRQLGADPVRIAWAEFLQRNAEFARDLEKDSAKSVAAFENFKRTLNVEAEADTMTRLQDALRETTQETDALNGSTDRYSQTLQEFNINAGQVTPAIGEMVKKLIEARQQFEQSQRLKQQIEDLSDGISGIFQNSLTDLFENGFQSFFDSVNEGFRQMMQQMLADWIASQIRRLIMGLLTQLAGGLGGSGGGGTEGLGDFNLGGIDKVAAKGAFVEVGQRVLVGEHGPEVFVPQETGRIVPSGGNGTTVINNHYTWNVQTPDANSFRRTQSQLLRDANRSAGRSTRRDG